MARSFTSASNYLSASSITAPAVTTGATGSCTLRFKPNWSSGDSTDHFLGLYYASGSPNSNRIQFEKFSDNNFYVGVYASANDERVQFADTGIVSGTWYNLTCTWTIATLVTAYLNGVSKGTNSGAVTPGSAMDTLKIGVDPSNANTANASIAELATWNVVLTAGEITALSNGARPSHIRPASLIANYPIDGLQSPEPDLSGNAKNLTMTGTAPVTGGPPTMMFTPRWPQITPVGAAASSVTFRRTLSALGTRAGSRQAIGT